MCFWFFTLNSSSWERDVFQHQEECVVVWGFFCGSGMGFWWLVFWCLPTLPCPVEEITFGNVAGLHQGLCFPSWLRTYVKRKVWSQHQGIWSNAETVCYHFGHKHVSSSKIWCIRHASCSFICYWISFCTLLLPDLPSDFVSLCR